MWLHDVLSLLVALTSIHQALSIGFHLPPPESFTHSCTPTLGSWAVQGNVTIKESDLDYFSSNLTLNINGKTLCNIDLEACPETPSSVTSYANSPNVCACLDFVEDDYSIYIRQETRSPDIGGLLTIVIHGKELYAALESTQDIGHIPGKTDGNITYQIDGRSPLKAPCPETATSPARQEVTLSNGIQALCDSWTRGGNWVVIQRRVVGDVDFSRSWAEYLAGFGDVKGDHWMGLQDIHTLCPPGNPCTLRVDLKDDQVYKTGHTVWAEYSSFSVGGFTEKYGLTVSGYNTSSTLGDSLQYHSGVPFSTYDRENDNHDTAHCATIYHGGWWYNKCHLVNLNGKWGERNTAGLRWLGSGNKATVYATYSEMKVRIHS